MCPIPSLSLPHSRTKDLRGRGCLQFRRRSEWGVGSQTVGSVDTTRSGPGPCEKHGRDPVHVGTEGPRVRDEPLRDQSHRTLSRKLDSRQFSRGPRNRGCRPPSSTGTEMCVSPRVTRLRWEEKSVRRSHGATHPRSGVSRDESSRCPRVVTEDVTHAL